MLGVYTLGVTRSHLHELVFTTSGAGAAGAGAGTGGRASSVTLAFSATFDKSGGGGETDTGGAGGGGMDAGGPGGVTVSWPHVSELTRAVDVKVVVATPDAEVDAVLGGISVLLCACVCFLFLHLGGFPEKLECY